MSDTSSQVRVVVRVRPLLPHETAALGGAAAVASSRRCVQATRSPEGAPAILLREDTADAISSREHQPPNETQYTFDGVYETDSTNAALFEAEVGPHIARLFTGSSVTLFAFGMTGTGKSHSMSGTSSDPGLIPRTIDALFAAVSDRVACAEQEWETTSLNFSFFELYNEKIYDLLKPYAPPSGAAAKTDRSSSDSAASRDPALAGDLPVREDGSGHVFVAGLSESRLDSLATFTKAYTKGLANRRVASTKLNAASSRSHSMAVVRMEFRSKKAPFKKDNRHSGNTSSKSRMVESSKINNSLFVLGKVINGLNAGDSRIPYRDSKLTRLLQASLGGSNYAIMLCAVSPNPAHLVWTHRTLQFASKSRQIVNVVSHNVQDVPSPAAIAAAAAEEAERKADLKAKLEAWKSSKAGGSTAAAGAVKAKRLGSASSSSSSSASASSSSSASLSLSARSSLFSVPQESGGSSVDLSTLSALIAARQGHSQVLDPQVMKKLNSLAQDVSNMKQQMNAQHKQQQQQQQQQKQLHQRPAPAYAAAASAAASLAAPSSSAAGLVPLTPMSSSTLARISVEKARVWERAGALDQALAEYLEASRMRPGNEKLGLKIQQLQAKVARQAVGGAAAASPQTAATVAASASASASNAASASSGHKHSRDVHTTPLPRSKQRRVDTQACIVEEDEEEEEDEDEEEDASDESDDESDESDADAASDDDAEDESDASMSDGTASDYDPEEEEDDAHALWMKGGKATRRGGRSTETSPSSSSLLARITAVATTTPPAAAAPAAVVKSARPSTSPAALTSSASTVRTPLSTLATSKLSASTSASSSSSSSLSLSLSASHLPRKLSGAVAGPSQLHNPTSSSAAKVSTPPTGVTTKARISPKNAKSAAAATHHTVDSRNKENAVPPPTNVKQTAAAKADALVKPKPAVKPVASASPSALAVHVPPVVPAPLPPFAAPAGGLLLSNLVSGRDALLRVLNSGTLKELMDLQTIGKKRAQLILAKRDEMGGYATVEQFTQRNLMSTVWANANATQMVE